ncbi:hypothetical protein RICGR_0039 [Rickettsiella grylli]|uniref:Uncharacterized protein n=1 Tax=Rickettsiella grylli TaxID=59196 RepID=A8PKR2_9COXI|nr:hypothetical protein RICGR_0039 [Rickettsiella grylli]
MANDRLNSIKNFLPEFEFDPSLAIAVSGSFLLRMRGLPIL